MRRLIAVATCWLLAAGAPVPVETVGDVVYATPADQPLRLNLYLPQGAPARPRPVLVYMHGGGWSRGQRPDGPGGFGAFLDAGMAVVTVEYRLAGTAKAPAAVQDVRCAMAWVATNAGRYGFDPKRIVLTGTSAGGHLALAAGLLRPGNAIDLPACARAPAPAAILNQYGPTELRQVPGAWTSPSVAGWIGDGGDPIRTAMSPVAQARRGMPPVFTVHGDADPVVPVGNARLLKARLDALGVPNVLRIVPGGGHGKFTPEQRAAANRAMLDFLKAQAVLR